MSSYEDEDGEQLEPEDVARLFNRVKEAIISEHGISGLLVVVRRFSWAKVADIRQLLSEYGFQELFVAPSGGSDGAVIEALAFSERDFDIDVDELVLKVFEINGLSCKIVVKQLCPIMTDTYGGEGE